MMVLTVIFTLYLVSAASAVIILLHHSRVVDWLVLTDTSLDGGSPNGSKNSLRYLALLLTGQLLTIQFDSCEDSFLCTSSFSLKLERLLEKKEAVRTMCSCDKNFYARRELNSHLLLSGPADR